MTSISGVRFNQLPKQKQARFSGNKAAAPSGNAAFKAADAYLTMTQRFVDFVERNIIGKNTKGFAYQFGTFLKKNAEFVLDHDYKKLAKLTLPKFPPFWNQQLRLGRIVVSPPMGAMFVLLFGFTLIGRLKHAFDRAMGGDKRELRDIAFRDLPTFLIILYMLEPLTNKIGKWLQKFRGIRLLHGDEMLAYPQLKTNFQINSKNRLMSILQDSTNHKGVINAINKLLRNNNLTSGLKNHLTEFKSLITNIISTAGKADQAGLVRINEALVEKAFHKVQTMDSLLDATRKSMNQTFVQKITNGFIGKNIIPFNEMFSQYAKVSRVGADLLGFSIVIGLLGFGVTAFNKWLTEREFKELQSQRSQPATQPKPQQPKTADLTALLQALQGAQAPQSFQPQYPGMMNGFAPQQQQYGFNQAQRYYQ